MLRHDRSEGLAIPEEDAPPAPASARPGPAFADMAPLIRRVRDLVGRHRDASAVWRATGDLEAELHGMGFRSRGKGLPETILAEQVGVELGHPSTVSLAIALMTYRRDLVEDGAITLMGPDVDRLGRDGRHPFAQVVMCALREGSAPDPFAIDALQYLTHRVPGYMVRSVPGKLWVRIRKDALAKGLRMRHIGAGLVSTYRGDVDGIEGVEVVFVTAPETALEELAAVANEAAILAGRHKKLFLGADGEIECRDLDCESCDEKPVCNTLRDVVIARRSMRR